MLGLNLGTGCCCIGWTHIDSQPHTAWLNRILREKKYGAFNPGPNLIKMVVIRNLVTTGVHLHCEPAAEGEDYSDAAPPPPPPLGSVPQPEVKIFTLLVAGLHWVFVITQVLGFLTTAVAREGGKIDMRVGRVAAMAAHPTPPPGVGGWESLVIRRLHNTE
jgi:hypothetical protein